MYKSSVTIKAWGNKTKRNALSLKTMISFVLFPQASQPSVNWSLSRLWRNGPLVHLDDQVTPRFLKLSAQSSSLLHLSLRFFLPGSLGELTPSCSILNGCFAVSVVLISSFSLARNFGSPYIYSS